MANTKKVVVLGGGIGGVEAAIFAARNGFESVLISNREYLFVYPLAIWIPVGAMNFSEACVKLDDIAKANGFKVIIDAVSGLNTQDNQVILSQSEAVHYDYLVIATGATRTRMPGDEHIFSICDDPETSVAMKNALDSLITKGSGSIAVGFGGNPLDGSGVRGGPAFEIIFNLDTFLNKCGMRDRFELSFFAPMKNPGERLGRKPASQFAAVLDSFSVGRYFGNKIERFSEEGVHFGDQSTLKADLVFFIPARSGRPEYREWGIPVSEAGFIETDEGCRVHGFSKIYAVGDAASLLGPAWRAKQGHLAEVMARTAIKNITADAENYHETYSYVPEVSIMCLMDTGKQGIMVYRSARHEVMFPLFHAGHLLKKLWGMYYKKSKLRQIPRLPKM